MNSQIWTFASLRSGREWEDQLVAYWELDYSAISGDYLTNEINVKALFREWAETVAAEYPNELIPVLWTVGAPKYKKFEFMPFQFRPYPENFLTYYTWPVNKETGARLNWLTLPVVCTPASNFIQNALGWKPGILQPYAYLPALRSVAL